MPKVKTARQAGYISCEPHFNSVINGFKDPGMTAALLELVEATSRPLADFEGGYFAPDSSGFGNSLFVKWQEHKNPKKQKQHGWTKVHLMCGVSTHIITAVVIKDQNAADTKQLPELVKKTAKNFKITTVCADKAYGSLSNYKAIMDHGAVPYIPFKSNQTGEGVDVAKKRHPATPLWKRMHHLFSAHPDEFNAHYHERSNVESVFSMMKRTIGGAVRSKDAIAKHNEALCMVVCHNIRVLIKTSFEAGLDLGELLAPKRKPSFQVINGGLSEAPHRQ
jgi:transposase